MSLPFPADGGLTSSKLDMTSRSKKTAVSFSASVRRLRPATAEFVFLTPAILYRFAGATTERILVDYQDKYPDAGWLGFHRFDVPLFQGLQLGDDRDWNRALWLVPVSEWPSLHSFLTTAMMVSLDKAVAYQVIATQLQVPDPLAVQTKQILQADDMIPVVAYGLAGAEKSYYMDGSVSPPRLVTGPGHAQLPDVQRFIKNSELERIPDHVHPSAVRDAVYAAKHDKLRRS